MHRCFVGILARSQEVHITVSRTARYFMLGDPRGDIEQIWFVCHGYGQLASYFIKHFEVLDNGSRLIVAPEGLSRFYLQGVDGRIGASWMTREDRLSEIADYVGYLDRIYDEIFQKVVRSSVRVFVLGFSQATATVCRWLTQGRAKADELILWAGMIPPELKLAETGNIFQSLNVSLVVGRRDPYAKEDVLRKQQERLKANGIPLVLLSFEGGHHLDSETLVRLADADQPIQDA